ncbi:formate dehydrogenase subunit gamma [Mesorhizobium sp. NBSH29]|uniref:formate dehydrogenase subunit gamma n=1 Tax=Mesorhizobium sp. NBSH29 TaxID=2654249 RepID=UPI0018964181|nr:formate dehydrogenase subunit gamma [Mesorhizobium sp. NBSH29]QPC86703.1 formate dehydrogenase subunit gamma [Mesorhizobium sp. NBSH29]
MTMQPAGTETAIRAAEIVQEFKGVEGPLLPILHALQHEFGHVPQVALPAIAHGLNISNAEVHGVVSFYHDYRSKPAGRHVLKVCRAEACQSMGGEALAAQLSQALGIGFHETSADGSVTLEPIYCLGLCACAPAVMLDGQVMGRVDQDAFDAIIEEVRA